MMSGDFHASALRFAGTPRERLALFGSRKQMLWVTGLFLAALIAAVLLYGLSGDAFVFLILCVPFLVKLLTAIVWPAAARFTMRGDTPAILAYLDKVMSEAPEYQRSVGPTGEINFQRAGKGWLADSRSHCSLAVHGRSVEVSGSRDILRRLRYWGNRHFART